ncbi:MAG TPA: MFS transporter, partial [Pseudonocardiaceae bacterium]|nr:MFS transporter [Pseudonocardiaceae bacterium]
MAEEFSSRRWLALAVTLLAMVLDLIDYTIVTIANPSIQHAFGSGSTVLEWVSAGYGLAYGLGLVSGGRLGDVFGRRRMFLVGVAGFTMASMCCGLAVDPAMLIAARVAQGGFAAVMTPQILAMVQVNFPARERPKALAMFGAAAATAGVLGPLLGGLLLHADVFGLGWRAIFLVNLPIGVLTLVAAAIVVPEGRAQGPGRLDPLGVGLLTVGLLLVLYPLVEGRTLGWPLWMFVLMAAAVPVLGLFGWHQVRAQRAGDGVIVPPKLLRQRGFSGGLLAQLTVNCGLYGLFVVFAVILQEGLGYSPLRAGLNFLPFSVGVAMATPISGAFAARFGRGLIAIGSLLMASGLALLAIALHATLPGTFAFVPGMVVAGLGLGLVAPNMVGVALTGVDPRDAGAASGALTTAGQLGGALGVAALGSVFFGLLPSGFAGAAQVTLYVEVGVYLLAALLATALPHSRSVR